MTTKSVLVNATTQSAEKSMELRAEIREAINEVLAMPPDSTIEIMLTEEEANTLTTSILIAVEIAYRQTKLEHNYLIKLEREGKKVFIAKNTL